MCDARVIFHKLGKLISQHKMKTMIDYTTKILKNQNLFLSIEITKKFQRQYFLPTRNHNIGQIILWSMIDKNFSIISLLSKNPNPHIAKIPSRSTPRQPRPISRLVTTYFKHIQIREWRYMYELHGFRILYVLWLGPEVIFSQGS